MVLFTALLKISCTSLPQEPLHFRLLSSVTVFEELRATPEYRLSRKGRFLVSELHVPHRVLSTSTRNGGQRDDLRFLVNHQSCEGTGHTTRQEYITGLGLEAYHDVTCAEINLDPDTVALMGTAANMNYVAIAEHQDREVIVTAIVTAGVQGNAACAGDPAGWRELDGKWEKIIPYAGTINTILLINRPLTHAALARAVVTMTEGKSTALHRLAVGSLYSSDEATGTGTDQFCVAAPLYGTKPLSSTSPHVKLGELIGLAVRDATLEALRWQNGLEPSYTRGIFHALGRFGLNEARLWEEIAPQLSETNLDLLKKNGKSVFYEPLVAASAYALAAILDRMRYGTLPAAVVQEALRQSAAALSANLAAKPDQYLDFKHSLRDVDPEQPLRLILAAIAAGWSAKWT
jgi:adenosylcobinamide amidohydrolase